MLQVLAGAEKQLTKLLQVTHLLLINWRSKPSQERTIASTMALLKSTFPGYYRAD